MAVILSGKCCVAGAREVVTVRLHLSLALRRHVVGTHFHLVSFPPLPLCKDTKSVGSECASQRLLRGG